jgi:hypothetical protein
MSALRSILNRGDAPPLAAGPARRSRASVMLESSGGTFRGASANSSPQRPGPSTWTPNMVKHPDDAVADEVIDARTDADRSPASAGRYDTPCARA